MKRRHCDSLRRIVRAINHAERDITPWERKRFAVRTRRAAYRAVAGPRYAEFQRWFASIARTGGGYTRLASRAQVARAATQPAEPWRVVIDPACTFTVTLDLTPRATTT